MRFIAIDEPAATEITSGRLTQSVEYEVGSALAAVLQNPKLDVKLSPSIRIERSPDGLFMLGPPTQSRHFVVFDLDTCGLFEAKNEPADVVLYVQKVLRFALKRWNNLKPSIYEKLPPGSTKAVIFPYPISRKTSFRISVELAPDSKRQAKRAPEASSLLVYRSGTDEGGGPQEVVSTTSFRRFLDAVRTITSPNIQSKRIPAKISSINVTALDGLPAGPVDPYQGYERWLAILTDKQKEFVQNTSLVPHRIEGPAGTGKTLSLVLRAICSLHRAEQLGEEHRALFITHSEATRRTVDQLIATNDPWNFLERTPNLSLQTLKLTTLQQLCGDLLQRKISDSEFLDRDAMESKALQYMYVDEALKSVHESDYPTHKKFLSARFDKFLDDTPMPILAEMFQHEISVVIKGRAEENFEHYKKLPPLRYGLPTETSSDRGFVWNVYKKYQAELQTAAQFDTDDIVLTTIGQLDTPIWRRRRTREGYNTIYIDETHLFNVNELSVFHHLSRSLDSFPIAYSVDRAQAIGDRDWSDELFDETLSPDLELRRQSAKTQVRAIFRCSPDIVNLAFSVTSAGATLFTNFEDPLKLASSMFTADEERRAVPPVLMVFPNDEEMVISAFKRAEEMADSLESPRCAVAIVPFSADLLRQAEALAREQNKPVEILKQRGDIEVVQRARQTKRFVLSMPEYIGGLDFHGVILVGVDDGRVPPSRTTDSIDSLNFLSYSSHNRLYVAITRARYRVEVLIAKDRGASSLLRNAIQTGLLTQDDQG